MTQILDAQRAIPDCSAIKRRRQATQAKGDFGTRGRCTKTYPARLIRSAALALRDVMRRFATAQRRRAAVLTLQSLDAHTLRDLGFDRSEIPSAVAELLGEVEVTRARFVQCL